MEDLFSAFSADQLTDTNYCDIMVKPAYNQQHKWQTACKHCFMTSNTISLVSWLIWKRSRWKLIYIHERHIPKMFAPYIHAFLLIYYTTPCESSGRFFLATRYIYTYINKNLCLYFTHLPRSPPWTDLHEILHRGSSRRRNQLCQILSQSD